MSDENDDRSHGEMRAEEEDHDDVKEHQSTDNVEIPQIVVSIAEEGAEENAEEAEENAQEDEEDAREAEENAQEDEESPRSPPPSPVAGPQVETDSDSLVHPLLKLISFVSNKEASSLLLNTVR